MIIREENVLIQISKIQSCSVVIQNFSLKMRFEQAKAEMQGNQPKVAIKAFKDRRASNGEKKMALQQDVDKLRKRLRQEENIHRALERAFNRPLGALPRLPPYLPPSTLELLAEVAVLEEEVVRLEEQVVHFRQDLYQEAVYLSSSKRHMENLADSDEPTANKSSELEQPAVLTRTLSKIIQLQSLSDSGQGKANQSLSDSTKNNSATLQWKAHLVRTPVKRPPSDSKPIEKPSDPTVLKLEQPASLARQLSKRMQLQSFSDDVQVKENQSVSDSTKNNKATLQRKAHLVRTPVKRPPSDSSPVEKPSEPQRLQVESGLQEQDSALALSLAASDELSVGHDGPNRISEEMVKCLSSIILRTSPIKSRGAHESDESTDLQDPYRICSAVGRRDIGPYKHLLSIEANSVFPKRTSNSLFLLHQLKILFERLSYVKLQNLNHQEKLAFWINIYNSCMMNAFLQHGIPESPSMVVELMRKETINVGGYLLNAITIEHFILRLPYHLKYTSPKGAKNDELTLRSMFGLELSEPLVTFALCCGSWSSPAVRLYTAAHVENELEVAKREYLRAAIGISSTRLVIPKLLDWYLLDFAKDLDSLLDWICLQLPSEVGKEAIKYLERAKGERVKHFVQVMPYDFRFRYLISST